MPLFVITAIDRPGGLPLRMATRERHFAWLATHPGAVRLGGPFLDDRGDMAGSLIILEAADLEAARNFAAEDPYAQVGLFAEVNIRPWRATVGQVP